MQLLEVIRRENGVTRADLRQLTGLSRSAVAEAVQDLLDARLIDEHPLRPGGRGSGRGRPSAVLVARPDGGRVLGMDFGHEHVSVAVAGTGGDVLAEQRLDVDVDENPEAALNVATGVATRLVGQLRLRMDDIRAAVVGLPTPLDVRTNQLHPHLVMPAWSSWDVAGELGRLLGRPVTLANDAELGALGEFRFGAARGMRDFVYLKASGGIGASVFLNGSVYRGAAGLAGEIGHLRLGDAGLWCRCGNRGCLETVLSANLLERRMQERPVPPRDPAFPLRQRTDDPVISAFVVEAGRTLGRVLADLCNWINPAGILLGGVLGTAGQPMVDGVRESIVRYTSVELASSLTIRPAQLGLRSELMGAVAVAIQEALHLPGTQPA